MKTATTLLIALALTMSCAGRGPNPIQISQIGDSRMSCGALLAEHQGLDGRIHSLRAEGSKGGYNALIFVAGLFTILAWFAFDFRTGGAVRTEIAAIQARQTKLMTLYNEECHEDRRGQTEDRGNQRDLDIERDERRHGELIDAIRGKD